MIERAQGVTGVAGWPVVQSRAPSRPRPEAGTADGSAPPRPSATMAFRPFDRRAEFLAQLIAMRDGLPQARERRRAAPEDAVRAYRTAATVGERPEAGFDETA
jgi:hypothetical protein